jgi:hypothetical protein
MIRPVLAIVKVGMKHLSYRQIGTIPKNIEAKKWGIDLSKRINPSAW